MRLCKNLSPGVGGPVLCVVPVWCPCPLSHVLFCISCRLLLCLMSSGITHGTEIAFASGCGSAGVGGKVPRARGGIAWIMPSIWSSSLSVSAPSVLIHCRQGKHRSGAIGCFMFCLLTGCDFNMAMNAYRTRNRRLEGWDVRLVRRCWGENNMDEALHYFRRQ